MDAPDWSTSLHYCASANCRLSYSQRSSSCSKTKQKSHAVTKYDPRRRIRTNATFQPLHRPGFEGSRLKCCGVAEGFSHPECLPIDIPEQDPYYGRFGQRCLEYVRSSTAPRETCGLGPREQNNQVSEPGAPVCLLTPRRLFCCDRAEFQQT